MSTEPTQYLFPSSRVAPASLKETILCGILQLLAIIAVWLRLWARRINRKPLEFNDYAIFVALFTCFSLLGVAILSTVWSGKGFHTHDVDPAYRSRVFVAFTAGQPLCGFANTAVKLSILHLYLKIFLSVRFRRLVYVMMVISMCNCAAVLMETFLVCKPVQYNWNKKLKGTCSPHAKQTYLVSAILNMIIDIVVVAMPMPILWNLKMLVGKKVGLIAVFSVGGVICVVSVLRVLYMTRMDLHDFHYTYANLGMWAIVEPQLGIVNACMPLMQPFLRKLAKSSACQRMLPASWLRSTHAGTGRFPAPVIHDQGDAKRSGNPNCMDRLYPLDTVHLVGKKDISVTDSAIRVDVERAESERRSSIGVTTTRMTF